MTKSSLRATSRHDDDSLEDKGLEDKEKRRELRANALFAYIEIKDIELKAKKQALLQSIVNKQRLKIEQECERWESKRKQLLEKDKEKTLAIYRAVRNLLFANSL